MALTIRLTEKERTDLADHMEHWEINTSSKMIKYMISSWASINGNLANRGIELMEANAKISKLSGIVSELNSLETQKAKLLQELDYFSQMGKFIQD